MMSSLPSLIALAIASPVFLGGSVQASKDSLYYRPGTGNPNTNQKMYWQDSRNVLEDLSQFSYLYVKFHHCAWTEMRRDSDEDDGDVEENDYWYIGAVPDFGANVAFSLYGSLKGDSFEGCNKNTFINSFYTNTGFTEFATAMGYAGVNGFNYDYADEYSAECQGGYGVGCDYDNGFAVHTYSTEYCDPAYFSGVKDTMTYLNQAMANANCVQIYNYKSGQNWYYGNVTVSGTPLELLAYSNACFYQNYWSPDGQCPDPYGKLQAYQQNFNKGVTNSKKKDPFEQYTKQIAETKRMKRIGAFMMVCSLFVLFISCCAPKLGHPKKLLSALPKGRGRFFKPKPQVTTSNAPPSPRSRSNSRTRATSTTPTKVPRMTKPSKDDSDCSSESPIGQSRSSFDEFEEPKGTLRGKLKGLLPRK